jgi:hypothetical protein
VSVFWCEGLAEGLCEVHSEAEVIVKCRASNRTVELFICQVAAEVDGTVKPPVSNIT